MRAQKSYWKEMLWDSFKKKFNSWIQKSRDFRNTVHAWKIAADLFPIQQLSYLYYILIKFYLVCSYSVTNALCGDHILKPHFRTLNHISYATHHCPEKGSIPDKSETLKNDKRDKRQKGLIAEVWCIRLDPQESLMTNERFKIIVRDSNWQRSIIVYDSFSY